MKKEASTALTEPLIEHINSENLVLLASVDHESGYPSTSAMSWVRSVRSDKLQCAVASGSRIVSNIRVNPKVSMTLFSNRSIYTVLGEAAIVEEELEGIAIKLSKIEVTVTAVYPSMFWGAEISQEPQYVKTMNAEKSKKLDMEVFAKIAH